MRDFPRKLAHWLSLDTDKGAAGVEYAVIVGLAIGGILVWFFGWQPAPR